jgi:hypothetical protein
MPRAGSNHQRYNRVYEAKQRAAGMVRGPRLTPEAAESLRLLAFKHRLTPSEVVCRLLLDLRLDAPVAASRSEQIRKLAEEFGVCEAEAEVMLGNLPTPH